MSTPNVNDFVAGLDPTYFATITGAQLAQLVNSAEPSSDRGLIVISTDSAGLPNVPNASTIGGTPEWQRYIWLRISPTYVTAYVWNPGGATDDTYLNWITISQASIGPSSIQGYQIAGNTITAGNISTVSSGSIQGNIPAGWLASLNAYATAYATHGVLNDNSPIFGVLNGAGSTVVNPVFGAAVIPQTAFTAQTIAGNATAVTSPIVDNSIVSRQLANSGAAASSTPLTTAAVDPANNIILPTKSQVGIPVFNNINQNIAVGDVLGVAYGKQGLTTINYSILAIGNPATPVLNQSVIAAAGGLTIAYQNANSTYFGRSIQKVFGTVYTTGVNCTASGSYSISDNVAGFNSATPVTTGIAVTITPTQGVNGSKIIIEGNVPTFNTTSGYVWLGLYDSVAAAFVAWAKAGVASSNSQALPASIRFVTAALSVNTTRTYTVFAATTSGQTTGGTNPHSEGGMLIAEEYL
jgi:hypothetical protein